jgi:hypothetical protein
MRLYIYSKKRKKKDCTARRNERITDVEAARGDEEDDHHFTGCRDIGNWVNIPVDDLTH